jgi:Flp pilus assembly protein TadG
VPLSAFAGIERPSSGGPEPFRDLWRERGANLVEFAIVMPFLILLLIGIIEFAWLFSQNLDVRHGAREGARLAAVNFPVGPTDGSAARTAANRDALVAEICNHMSVASGASIDLQSSGAVGADAIAVITAPGNTLTGLLDWALPSSLTLSSQVEIRVEQPATWANTSGAQACP